MHETWTEQRQLDTCRLLSAAYGSTGEQATGNLVHSIFGTSVNVEWVRWESVFPSAIIVRSGGVTYVYIAGLYHIQQTLGVVSAHFSFMVQSPYGDVNPLYLSAATRLYRKLDDMAVIEQSRYVVAGHSYGGAVATVLGRMLAGKSTRQINVYTAGAPMPGSQEFCLRFGHQLDVFRCMDFDDPVPLLPRAMRALDEGALAGATALWKTQAGRYDHPGRGSIMLADGAQVPGPLPEQSASIAASVWDEVRGGSAGYFGAGHLINTYAERLQRRVSTTVEKARGSQVNRLVTLPTPVFSATMKAREEIQMPNSLPRATVFIPKPFRAKMVVSGNVFQVHWMGYTIATYFNRSPARTLAKRLNGFVKLLQRGDAVSPTQMQYALTNYLQEAASGSGGFKPVMSTSLT